MATTRARRGKPGLARLARAPGSPAPRPSLGRRPGEEPGRPLAARAPRGPEPSGGARTRRASGAAAGPGRPEERGSRTRRSAPAPCEGARGPRGAGRSPGEVSGRRVGWAAGGGTACAGGIGAPGDGVMVRGPGGPETHSLGTRARGPGPGAQGLWRGSRGLLPLSTPWSSGTPPPSPPAGPWALDPPECGSWWVSAKGCRG